MQGSTPSAYQITAAALQSASACGLQQVPLQKGDHFKCQCLLNNSAHLLMLGLLQPQLAHFWVGIRLRKSPATSLSATTVCAVAVPLRSRPPPAGKAAGAIKCSSGCAPASRMALARHISQLCWSDELRSPPPSALTDTCFPLTLALLSGCTACLQKAACCCASQAVDP